MDGEKARAKKKNLRLQATTKLDFIFFPLPHQLVADLHNSERRREKSVALFSIAKENVTPTRK